ncbi:MAG: hypothetical protein HIU92_17245 [Proteobacteria bacterium]|nr:hypothetical protein [Pseudomonadota bacterium]
MRRGPCRLAVAASLVIAGLLAGCSVPGRGLVSASPQTPNIHTVQNMESEFGRVPLVTIAASAPPGAYRSALADAVQAARARKPDVVFDVLSAVPQTGTATHQITAAKGLTPDAAEVAQAIMADGVPADRITLGSVVVPHIPGDQLRVYVR